MDYWQTIELIKQDWGMGHPLTDKETRNSIVQMLDDIAEHIEDFDDYWLSSLGLRMADGDGVIDFIKGDAVCKVKQGPTGKIFVNGQLLEPTAYYFTIEFYELLKHEIENWAVSVA